MEKKVDKVKIKFEKPKKITVKYKNIEIKINPLLEMAEQVYLINSYVEDYFGISENPLVPLSEYNYIEAEFKLLNYLCQLATNIDYENIDANIYIEPEFQNLITENIVNYPILRKNLDTVVKEIKEQLILKNSLGKVISDLVEKGYSYLDKLSDITPEELEKMKYQGIELIERLEKSPLSEALQREE